MSIQIQKFMPYSRFNISDERLDLGIELQNKKIEKLLKHLFRKVIIPILRKDYKKTQPLSDKKIKEFMKISISITETLQQKYNVEQLGQSDLQAYQDSMNRLKTTSWIQKQQLEDALEMVDILMDYHRIVTPIAINNLALLENAGKQIDLDDLFRSLYGSQLAYLCLLTILAVEEFQDDQRFLIITSHGYDFAKNLDGYIDTIDILTKPEEDERLRKIK